MNHKLSSIQDIIPQSNIIVFSPHYDDFLLMMGGYVLELKKLNHLPSKNFHIHILFSRSNYLARTGSENFNGSLDRIKFATGKRLLEDQECINALLGRYNYRYELAGEDECFVRGKAPADSEMEFPHGMYEDFNELDWAIFERMKKRIHFWSAYKDTALVFPTAFKEHMDHFITREAAIAVAKELGTASNASFYFQEDKPYGGIATPEEQNRVEGFINKNRLISKTFECDPEEVIHYAFTYYVSQVEEVYKTGIRARAKFLQESQHTARPCDRIYLYNVAE